MFPFIASMFLISECDLRPGINHFHMAPAASELSRVNDLRARPVWLRGNIIMGIHSRDWVGEISDWRFPTLFQGHFRT
jgi:hypothetical protein